MAKPFAQETPIPFPVTFEVSLFEEAGELLDDQCAQRGNKVLEHMSTANVARDLDVRAEFPRADDRADRISAVNGAG